MFKILHLPTATFLYRRCIKNNSIEDVKGSPLYTEFEIDIRHQRGETLYYYTIFFSSKKIALKYIKFSEENTAFTFGDDFELDCLKKEHCEIIGVDNV